MAQASALGTAPSVTPVPYVINRLLDEQVRSTRIAEIAMAISPSLSSDALVGSFPVETGYFGLSLSEQRDPGEAVSYTSTQYPEIRSDMDSTPYEIERYNLAAWSTADVQVASIIATTGKDLNQHLAEKSARIAAETYARKVFTQIGTSGNWDSDHTADPGDITASSFNFVGEIVYTAQDQMLKANVWNGTGKLAIVIAWDVAKHLMTLQQVRTSVAAIAGVTTGETQGQVLTSVATLSQIEAGIASLFEGDVDVHIAKGYYRDESDAPTLFMPSGTMAVLPVSGGVDPTFLRTVLMAGKPSPLGELVAEYDNALGGYQYWLSAYYDVLRQNDKAGYLFTGLGA